jgi:hypothetical protein
MKMKQLDYFHLAVAVQSSPVFPELMEYRAKGLSDKRYRWDCLWAINSKFRNEWFAKVYTYLNDTHIDTALKKITNTN